jgi:cell division protein FtsB
MQEFQEKRKLRKIIFSRKVLVLLAFVSAFLIFSTVKVYIKSRNAVSKNEEIKKEVADLEQRKSDLQKEISRLQSESGAEEEVRKKFNVQKPGEEVLVIVEKNNENDKINQGESSGFFTKIWQWIKNIW